MSISTHPSVTLESTDGVSLALRRLREREGAPRLLIAHATGFCGAMYEPLSRALEGFEVFAHDFRGHGDSTRPRSGEYAWLGFAADVRRVAEELATRSQPLFGFGHSMGGAALIMAEVLQPGTFRGLYVYEPVLFPPEALRRRPPPPIAVAARRRREIFPDREAALENFTRKPPLSALDLEVLQCYVENAFEEIESGVRLKCRREDEAKVFSMSGMPGCWERLPEIGCPVWVARGVLGGAGPAGLAPQVCERIPGATLVEVDGVGHLGPFEKPQVIGADVAARLQTLTEP